MKIIPIVLFLLIAIQSKSVSQTNFKNEFGFRSDNDAYLALGQDRYYTNGLFINFKHALPQKNSVKKIWEAEAGQYMYNAFSGYTATINEIDRPFAAYLYGGFKLNWFKANEDHFQAGLQIGTIGPDAKGKEVQEALHRIVGFYTIKGWEYQVNNELSINGSFNYEKLLARKEKNDLILTSYINAGNTFSRFGAGFLYRTGNFNSLTNSITTNSRISNSQNDSIAKKEAFFYARPLLSFVGYNATIQGGVFTNTKGPAVFTPNRLLFTQEFGLMYAKNRWSLNFSVIFQTKELSEQVRSHQYGSASVYYRFN